MLSTKVFASRRLCAGNLVKARVQSRAYRQTWFDPHEVTNERLDRTMYNPMQLSEREVQSTWREPIQEEDELEYEKPRHPVPKIPETMPQPPFDPKRRIQKVPISAGEFLLKFISTQQKHKMLHCEAEAFSDRW